jgi:hypothetical protein
MLRGLHSEPKRTETPIYYGQAAGELQSGSRVPVGGSRAPESA